MNWSWGHPKRKIVAERGNGQSMGTIAITRYGRETLPHFPEKLARDQLDWRFLKGHLGVGTRAITSTGDVIHRFEEEGLHKGVKTLGMWERREHGWRAKQGCQS